MTFEEEAKTLKGLDVIKVGFDGDGTLVVDVSDVPSEKMIHSILVVLLEEISRREMDRYVESGMNKDAARREAEKTIGAAFLAFFLAFSEKDKEAGALS